MNFQLPTRNTLKESVLLMLFITALNNTILFGQTDHMVQLQTGNFMYSVPLVSIPAPGGGSYPISMYYAADAAAKPESEASWAGLGWDINPGSIHRDVKGIPDDWNNKTTDVINYNEQWNAGNGYIYDTRGSIQSYDPGISTVFLKAKTNKQNFGSLYLKNASTAGVSAYKLQANYATDVYTNPYSESTYADAVLEAKQNPLSFPNYDNYSVSGAGIAGSISPKLYEFGQLLKEANVFSYYSGGQKKEEVFSHEHQNVARKFSKTTAQIYFQFDYDASGFSDIVPGQFNNLNLKDNYVYTGSSNLPTTNPDGLVFYNSATKRAGQGKYVEFFTNADIKTAGSTSYTNAVSRGFIETPSQVGMRGTSTLYDQTGIGAFSITNEDGTTYHYSVPVYQFEEFLYIRDKTNPGSNSITQRKLNMYATDWLLTAITGSDYIDKGTIGMIDDADEGYYIQFDYGKWTDGYIWRNPLAKDQFTDGTDGDYQYCSIGRKQIYYLNSIKTKTHTAFFVKSLRLDARGQQIQATNNRNLKVTKQYVQGNACAVSALSTLFQGYTDGTVTESDVFDAGEANYQLKLDKIILLTNADAQTYATALSGNNNTTSGTRLFKTTLDGTFKTTGVIASVTSQQILGIPSNQVAVNCAIDPVTISTFKSYYQNNVLDVKDLVTDITAIEANSLQEVELTQDYLLCGNVPTSSATGGNKLTLNTVQTFGISKTNLLKPYKFHYTTEQDSPFYTCPTNPIPYSTSNRDGWDYFSLTNNDLFNKRNSDSWCLNEIITPTGGVIGVEYESDTYIQQAIGGITTFTVSSIYGSYFDSSPNTIYCKMPISVLDYAQADLFVRGNGYNVVVTCENPYNDNPFPFGPKPTNPPPLTTTLILRDFDVSKNLLLFNLPSGNEWAPFVINYQYVYYTITLQPTVFYGGGIRVKNIFTNDGSGSSPSYKTTYNYNNPGTNKTSGITSYTPSKTSRYIPYMYEIPTPGVMYQYVTVENIGANDESYMKTRYLFDVIQASTGSGSGDFTMGDKLTVKNIQPAGYYDNIPRGATHWDHIYSRVARVEDNKAAIGRLLEVATLNKGNQVMNKTSYQYFKPGTSDVYKNGISEETFGEIKEFISYTDPRVNTKPQNTSAWYLISSSRKTYPSLLKSITTESNGITQITSVNAYNLHTGTPVENQVVNNDGTKYKTKTMYAYTTYTVMGSKTLSLTSKNMLTQQLESKSYIVKSSQDKLLSANVQTWNNSWTYHDYNASLSPPSYTATTVSNSVWRKGASYIWKSAIGNDGIIADADFVEFDKTSIDTKWKKANEVTTYDHFSLPVQMVDINGNATATKMCRDSRYAIASSGISTYNSFTHSGFEDALNADFFEGEVGINGAVSSQTFTLSGVPIKPHTGNYFVKVPITPGSIGSMPVSGFSGPIYKFAPTNSTEKNRTYRASVWVHSSSPLNSTYLVAVLDGTVASNHTPTIAIALASQSTIQVANWKLLSVNITVPSNYSATSGYLGFNDLRVFVLNWDNGASSGGDAYVDDLRVQPVDSPVSGNIYDSKTGFMSAVLDNENFATIYTYDGIGRTVKVEKETVNGIKKVKETAYHYKE